MSNDVDIANKFVNKFKFYAGLPEKYVNYDLSGSSLESNLLFTMGKIDSAIKSKLKLGTPAGLDGIQSEHIVYAHPAVVMHLHNLFNLVMQHEHVPAGFSEGVITSIVKDKCCDVLNSDTTGRYD